VLRQLFSYNILGVVDIMELSLVALIFVALPGVFLRDENITVDVIDQLVSRRVRVALRMVALVITLGFLALMFVQMIPQALDKWRFSEVTMTLSINRFTHWVPIMFAFVVSIIATVWVTLYYVRYGVPKDQHLDRGDMFE
jgi:TRAP-type C4-dicarboxylate transport system permease small subunit